MSSVPIARRSRPARQRLAWLAALLASVATLGTELRAQSTLVRECPAILSLETTPTFADPAASLRYEWRDGQGTVVGREAQLPVELGVGTHVRVSVVTTADGRTARDEIRITVEDTTPPRLAVGRPRVELAATAAGEAELDLAAALRVTADDACDPIAPVVGWDPPPPYPPGDTTVTIAATDRTGNRATTRVLVRIATTTPALSTRTPTGPDAPPPASTPVITPSPGPPRGLATPDGGGRGGLRPTGGDPTAADPESLAQPGAGVGVSGGPGLEAGAPLPSARSSSPPTARVGGPAESLGWGGVALGGVLIATLLLVVRRSARTSPVAPIVPVVFRAVARPVRSGAQAIRPRYVPPRYRLDLRPHAGTGTHRVGGAETPGLGENR